LLRVLFQNYKIFSEKIEFDALFFYFLRFTLLSHPYAFFKYVFMFLKQVNQSMDAEVALEKLSFAIFGAMSSTSNCSQELPRERILTGNIKSLKSEDLLSVLLGSGSKNKNVFALASEVNAYLAQLGHEPSIDELLQISGLGKAKAATIMAAIELSSRFLLGQQVTRIRSPRELLPLLAFLKSRKQESTVAITLSGNNTVLGIHELTTGLLSTVQLDMREAFAPAFEKRASAIVFAHNHPSGDLRPSPQDLALTQRLTVAGHILDIPVLDHLIVGHTGIQSIRELREDIFNFE
jgi:DNA repair protein RadC